MSLATMVNSAMNSTSWSGRLTGPPLCILMLAVTLEVLFWTFNVQVQFVEVWIVVLVVPLALSLVKPAEEGKKRPPKKMAGDDLWDPRKKVRQVSTDGKPVEPRKAPAERPAQSAAEVERD